MLLEHSAIAEIVGYRNAGVIDQHVERVDLLNGALNLCLLGHVEDQRGDARILSCKRLPRPRVHAHCFLLQRLLDECGPPTVWICGGYRLAAGVRHPLTSVLPDVVVITAAEARGTGLGAAVDLIAAEAGGTDPGAPAVMASLVDLLLVYLLRTWFAGHHDNAWGRALSDPTVGTALSLIHTDPGRAWTLDTLARATQTPRATLTRRFAALTGQSPIAYLTAWRMSLAARRLRDGDATVRQIAHEVGYDSEFAFARAFKRATGSAPGQHRKLAQISG